MKFMVLVKATASTEAGEMPDQELLTQMMEYNTQLVNAGVMRDGDGLHPSSKGARIHFDGDQRQVERGPFEETRGMIAGYWIWEAASLDDAVEWAKKCPNPTGARSELEIRQIFTAEDFGDALSPELKAQEDELRSRSKS